MQVNAVFFHKFIYNITLVFRLVFFHGTLFLVTRKITAGGMFKLATLSQIRRPVRGRIVIFRTMCL